VLYIHQSEIINHAKSLWLAKKCDLVPHCFPALPLKLSSHQLHSKKARSAQCFRDDPSIYHHLNLLASQKRNEPTKTSKHTIINHAGELLAYKGTLALTFVLKSEQTIFIRDIIMVIRVSTAIRALILFRRDNTPYS
jgi:hypothetical protein